MCDMMWLGLHITTTDELIQLVETHFLLEIVYDAVYAFSTFGLSHYFIFLQVVFTEYFYTCSVHDDAVHDTSSC